MLFAAIANIRQVETADPFPGNPVRLAPLRVAKEVGARLRWTAGIIVHCVIRDTDVHNAGTDRSDPAAGRLGHRQIGVALEPGEKTRRCSAWRADPLQRPGLRRVHVFPEDDPRIPVLLGIGGELTGAVLFREPARCERPLPLLGEEVLRLISAGLQVPRSCPAWRQAL